MRLFLCRQRARQQRRAVERGGRLPGLTRGFGRPAANLELPLRPVFIRYGHVFGKAALEISAVAVQLVGQGATVGAGLPIIDGTLLSCSPRYSSMLYFRIRIKVGEV